MIDPQRSPGGTTPPLLNEGFQSFYPSAPHPAAKLRRRGPTAFPEGWIEELEHYAPRTTGISFLDALLNGGQAAGESYGLLGPMGGGKTTLGTMITAQNAKRAYVEYEAAPMHRKPPIRKAYHISYKEPLVTLRVRALCYLSRIPKQRLTALLREDRIDELCGPGEFADYESVARALSAITGIEFPAESQRYALALAALARHWMPVDMTVANRDAWLPGCNYIDGLQQIIAQDLRAERAAGEEQVCGLVLVDNVMAAVRWYSPYYGPDAYEILDYVGGAMKQAIAIPFDCPVWSLHQLNARGNRRRPHVAISEYRAAESRWFAASMDVCLSLSVKDKQSCMRIGVVHSIRPPKVGELQVQLHGDFARFEERP